MRTVLFPGSFDPFTIGHADIVGRLLPLFDRVVVAVGVNPDKCYSQTADQRREAISLLYADEPRVKVITYDDLTIAAARREEACCIVKGVRNGKDLQNELQQARYNKEHGNIETLLLPASPGMEDVSSTRVRQLRQEGKPVGHLLGRQRKET